jgi:NADH-quinone oxidoreductase subunit H
LKTSILAFLFVWVRGTLPRIRYDQLITLTWKCFLPISLTALLTIFLLVNLWYCAGMNG